MSSKKIKEMTDNKNVKETKSNKEVKEEKNSSKKKTKSLVKNENSNINNNKPNNNDNIQTNNIQVNIVNNNQVRKNKFSFLELTNNLTKGEKSEFKKPSKSLERNLTSVNKSLTNFKFLPQIIGRSQNFTNTDNNEDRPFESFNSLQGNNDTKDNKETKKSIINESKFEFI